MILRKILRAFGNAIYDGSREGNAFKNRSHMKVLTPDFIKVFEPSEKNTTLVTEKLISLLFSLTKMNRHFHVNTLQ